MQHNTLTLFIMIILVFIAALISYEAFIKNSQFYYGVLFGYGLFLIYFIWQSIKQLKNSIE